MAVIVFMPSGHRHRSISEKEAGGDRRFAISPPSSVARAEGRQARPSQTTRGGTRAAGDGFNSSGSLSGILPTRHVPLCNRRASYAVGDRTLQVLPGVELLRVRRRDGWRRRLSFDPAVAIALVPMSHLVERASVSS